MRQGTKLILLSCVALLLFVGCGKKEEEKKPSNNPPEEKPVVNKNPGIVDVQEIDGLKFSDASMVRDNGSTVFSVLVTNLTGADYTGEKIDIVFKDKDDNIIMASYMTIPGDSIAKEEVKQLSFTTDVDLSSATTIEYTK